MTDGKDEQSGETRDRIARYEAENSELAARVRALEAELAARNEDLEGQIASARKRRRGGAVRNGGGPAPVVRQSRPLAHRPLPAVPAAVRRKQTARQIGSWVKGSPLGAVRRLREFAALRKAEEFDRSFYLRRNPDVANAGMNPVLHYIAHGARAGLDPSPTFSTSGYVRAHPELGTSGVNPLYHYVRSKRHPSPAGEDAATGSEGHPFPHPAIAGRFAGESGVALPVSDEIRAKARAALQLNPLRVSVVVPTLDRADSLREALRSAFEQSYQPAEVIVCDDGGSDETPAMLEREFAEQLAAGSLRVERHSSRRGASAARNTALALATGDLVAYLDSDNRWQPDFLLLAAARLAEGDDAAAAYTGLRVHGEGEPEPREIFDRFDRDQLLTRNYIDINSFVHRRRLYEQLGGFDEELTRLVDWDLILRYTRSYPAVAVPHCLVDYYAGEDGGRITHTEDFDANAERVRRRYAHERLQAGITPLRLAYVLWDYPALSQTFVLREIEQLAGDGHDVNVYFHQAPDRAAEPSFSVPTYEVGDADELATLLAEHGRTLVHSHFAYPAANRLAWPAARSAGIPFSFTVHAVDVFHRANRERNEVAEMAADELCARVFAIGEFHRSFLIDNGVPAQKISIARPAAELRFASAEQLAARPGRERRVVGAVTRFVAKKGLDDLIRAAPSLPAGTEVRLYGYGPAEDELRALAGELGAEGVRFMGPLERDGLAAALEEIDVFALPCVVDDEGDMDGLPTVIGEAMAAGVPVVSTPVAAIPDVIEDGLTGFLVEPRSPDRLAAKLTEVLAAPEEDLLALTEAAQRRAAATWDPARTAGILLDAWIRPPVEIALVSHSRFEDSGAETSAEIIRRIHELTTTPFLLRIVDNDSDDAYRAELAAAIAGRGNASLTLLDRNVHWGPALNLALSGARSDQLIYVCSKEGFVLRPGWERRFVDYMREHRNVAMAGQLVSSPAFATGRQYLEQPWFPGFRNKWFAERNPDREFSHVQGGLFVIRRAAYERCGGFSERTAQAAADVEYSYYLESLGWQLGEVAGVTSVTKKTRPTVDAHLDEDTVAAHPLTLESVGTASRVAYGDGAYCNVCAWRGDSFADAGLCPACGSTPFGRLLFRYLAGSPWPHRGLRCLAAIEDDRVEQELGRMFELSTLTPGELAGSEFGEHEIVIADLRTLADGAVEGAIEAIGAAVKIDGVAIVGTREIANGSGGLAERAFERAGYETSPVKLRSSTVRFASGGLLVAQHRLGYVASPGR